MFEIAPSDWDPS